MAKLLLFAPCEKAIQSKDDNSGSLVSIIQGFVFSQEVDLQGQTQMLIPRPWAVFVLWEQEATDDPDHPPTQKIEFVSKGGKTLLKSEVPITWQADKRFHRVIVAYVGVPIDGSYGDYLLRLYLREASATDYREVATFPVPMILSPAASVVASSALTQQVSRPTEPA